MNSTKRICCSQCGEVGHNKRNRNCPVNIGIREQEEEYQRELTLSTSDFNTAFDLLLATSHILRNADSPSCNVYMPFIEYDYDDDATLNSDLLGVIHKVIGNIDSVCHLLTNARVHCNITVLMDALEIHVNVLNRIIKEYVGTMPCELPTEQDYAKVWIYKICIQDQLYGIIPVYHSALIYQTVTLTSSIRSGGSSIRNILQTRVNIERLLTPIVHINVRPISTLDSLKQLSIVHDLSPDNEGMKACPICFDETSKGKLITTNCSHGFCVDCMINYADSIKAKTCKPTCPYCRTVVVEVKSADIDICRQFSHHILRMH